jgi:hypothetical protein
MASKDRTEPADDVAPLSAEEIADRVAQGEQFDKQAAIAAAVEAGDSLDDLLAELQEVQYEKGKWTNDTGEGKRRYDTLRDEVTQELEGLGSAYFVGYDGAKYYAVRRQAEPVEVDGDLLAAEISDDEALLDAVMPRSVDKKAFKLAVQDGRITSDVLVKVASIKPSKPYVQFVAPDAPS